MCAVRKSLRALSPSSQSCFLTSPIAQKRKNILHTTPSKPKSERFASVNRLLTAGHFSFCFPAGYTPSGLKQIKLDNENFPPLNLTPIVSVHISPSSPQRKHNSDYYVQTAQSSHLANVTNSVPFSPSALESCSPIVHSPHCRHPSPTSKPLYTPERRDPFLGRGSFGNVTLCQYKDHKFALKIVQHPASSTGEKNLLGIRHVHLVHVLHVSQVMDRVLVCMEFAGYCNLQQLLDTKGDLHFRRRLNFSQQVASGLLHCHSHQIVHRDVKPANVIVNPWGICKLGDFGLSVKIGVESEMLTSETGTAAYTAPEVLRGTKPSPSVDIYSFGMMLWQMHSREVPFAGEHPHVIIYKVVSQDVRPHFEQPKDDVMVQYVGITTRCWNKNPKKRPCSQEIVSVLRKLLNSTMRI